ncbi:hypothetical protein AB4Y72_16570 [Arthrobacter sp. YAF34]|uniref:hypothetical protein n=1 Tax=Arthrobacter sp. YAF34 TaxID=3233083 RepID=UPI003F92593E
MNTNIGSMTKRVAGALPGVSVPENNHEAINGAFASVPALHPPVGRTDPKAAPRIMLIQRWAPEDFGSSLTGSGARKLAESGVAPLVAIARGYRSLNADNYSLQAKAMGVRATTKQGIRLKDMCSWPGRDALQMPWHTPTSVQTANADGAPAVPFTYEIRPQMAEADKNGRLIESVMLDAAASPTDVHPATPLNWIDTTGQVMLVEGLMNGDAALTAYLLSMGVSREDLSYVGEETVDVLRALLEGIPAERRVLIVSVTDLRSCRGEVVNFGEIKLRGREAWILLSADPVSVPGLRAAATKLASSLAEKGKVASVRYAGLTVTDGDGETGWVAPADYLTGHGTWSTLVAALTNELPSAPEGSENEYHGAVRVARDGFSVEECFAIKDGPGGSVGSYTWKKIVGLGGRIKTLEAKRQPTNDELRTGTFDGSARGHDAADSRVEIEVSWETDGIARTALVTGPVTILSHQPADWVWQKANIPTNLLCHPSWPPRAAKGDAWLAALKANRVAETKSRTSWEQMGWVPVEGGDPVFLIGDQMIGEVDDDTSVCGLDERDVPTLPMFGVGDMLEGDFEDPEYREMVRKDFRDVVDAYITSGAWTDPGTAALVLGAALRPVLPLRPRATVYLWGPKGKGKSFSAKCMMYFWARRRANWQDQLPGSAKDTVAYIEMCVSRTPIWVVDDLAPSPVKRQAESEDAKLGDLTRSIFNNASKGRMNADMSSRKVYKPFAQLIITAENELTTPSAKERLIPAYLGHGRLSKSKEPTTRINQMSKEEGTQARFTSHLLRYIRYLAITKPGGWETFYVRLEDMRTTVQGFAETTMEERGATGGSLERATSLAADILVVFDVLALFANELDMGPEFAGIFALERGIGKDLVALVCDAHGESKKSNPGISLVRALSSLLASGGAHLISGQNPTKPPIQDADEDESFANHQLGWSVGNGSDGALKPNGLKIGTVVSKGGQKIIVFDKDTAFNMAAEAYPKLILPGQGGTSAWASVWDEGLTPSVVTRSVDKGGPSNTVRVDTGSGTGAQRPRVAGVPIALDLILAGGIKDQDEAYSAS